MQPEFHHHIKRNFELRAVLFFLIVLLLLLGSYTQKKIAENNSLNASMELLETFLEQQKEQNQHQFDSLQQRIQHQDNLHLRLLDTLTLLKKQRQHLKTMSNENKAAIRNIRDADSLYRLVARHYR